MTSTLSDAYPGSAACAADLVALAHAYRRAATELLKHRQPFSRAPATLCAIHAIELYLGAFLLHRGASAAEIRAHGHDLALRGAAVVQQGLILRARTLDHLAKITRDREYLASRYGPEAVPALSQTNRLEATLNEIASKVVGRICPPAAVPVMPSPPQTPTSEAHNTPVHC